MKNIPSPQQLAFLLKSAGNSIDNLIADMKAGYDKLNMVNDNDFHYFFQEQVEGQNGVVHIEDGQYVLRIGSNRGSIVNGVTVGEGLKSLTQAAQESLKHQLDTLFELFGDDLQIEFVATDSIVYIVQWKFIGKKVTQNPLDKLNENETYEVYGNGLGTMPKTKIDKNGIMYLKGDLEQNADKHTNEFLIHKKRFPNGALFIDGDARFAHIVALAKSLDYPVFFNVPAPNFYTNPVMAVYKGTAYLIK